MDSFKDGECVDPAVIAGSEAGLLINHDDEQGFLSA
jgi:hypothetical protein